MEINPPVTSTLSPAEHVAVVSAITNGETLRMHFNDNPRHIIPLMFGKLRNGRVGLLCYKLDPLPNGELSHSVRLYRVEKITNVQATGEIIPHSRRIEHFKRRHFAKVWA